MKLKELMSILILGLVNAGTPHIGGNVQKDGGHLPYDSYIGGDSGGMFQNRPVQSIIWLYISFFYWFKSLFYKYIVLLSANMMLLLVYKCWGTFPKVYSQKFTHK